MAFSAIRRAPLAALLMLGAIAVPAEAGWFDFSSKPAAKADAKTDAKTDTKSGAQADAKDAAQPAVTLDDSIQQARLLRLAGAYPEAIKHLSQVMMVASDDPRVISEYGKTLASMGRASDAVNFLTRAQQLQPGDWTVYSALGVAYDQTGDQKSAQANYEQALKLKPEEPSVLSNYALSRMLAKDPEMARKLVARAEQAGGAGDAVINRNIAMVRSLAPESAAPQVAQAPAAAPQAPVAVASLPAPPAASGENRVVMQKVPVDPLAGPVAPAAKPMNTPVAAGAAPRPLQPKAAEVSVPAPVPVKTAELKPVEAAKLPAPVKAATVKFTQPAPLMADKVTLAAIKIGEPAVTATAKAAPAATAAPRPLQAMPAAPLVAAKPATPVAAPVATAKVTAPAPVKAAEAKPVAAAPVTAPVVTAKAAAAASVTVKMTAPAPVKAAEAVKSEAAPKVLASTTKPADGKPVVKTVGQSKDAIPGLRLSANAY